jgi:hypothetical protein
MAAFKDYDYAEIIRTSERLLSRMEAAIAITFTEREALAMVAPPDRREILSCIMSVASVIQDRTLVMRAPPPHENRTVRLTLSSGNMAWPKYPAFQPDMPADLYTRLHGWIEQRTQIGRDFGVVRRLLYHLHERCANPSEVRAVWPAVLTLCRASPSLGVLADQVEDFKPPKRAPPIDHGYRSVCRTTAATITTASMLPSPDQDFTGDVGIRMDSEGNVYDEHIGNYNPM